MRLSSCRKSACSPPKLALSHLRMCDVTLVLQAPDLLRRTRQTTRIGTNRAQTGITWDLSRDSIGLSHENLMSRGTRLAMAVTLVGAYGSQYSQAPTCAACHQASARIEPATRTAMRLAGDTPQLLLTLMAEASPATRGPDRRRRAPA